MNKTAMVMVFHDLMEVIGYNEIVLQANDIVHSGLSIIDGDMIKLVVTSMLEQVGLGDLVHEIDNMYNEKLL